MRNRLVGLLLLQVLWIPLASCLTAPRRCEGHQLSRAEVIQIVESEIRRRGGELSANRKSKIQIKRDHCDYLYHEVYFPKRPGGYLFVRLAPDGTVRVFMPGV